MENANISGMKGEQISETDYETALVLEREPGISDISEDQKACALFLVVSFTIGASVTTCRLACNSHIFF